MAAFDRSTALPLVLVCLVLLAGCAAFTGGSDGGTTTTATPVGQNASAAYERVDSINATVEIRVDGPNSSDRIRFVVGQRLDTWEYRQRVLSPDGMAGNVYVSNGSVLTIYNATTNEVIRRPLASRVGSGRHFGRTLERIFDVVNDADRRTLAKPAVGVAPMPSMPTPTGGNVENGTNGSVGTLVVEYAGRTTVAGRETHVVHLTPTDPDGEGVVLLNQTLWLDTEYYFPVKSTVTTRLQNGTQTSTAVYEELTFNPGFDDDRFTFDPPANATVDGTDSPVSTFDSPDAAAEHLNFSVLSPTVPDGFELVQTSVIRFENVTAYRARYTNGTDTVVVAKQDNVTGEYPYETTPLELDGHTARYADFGTKRSAIWDCGGYRYSMMATLSKSQVREVAKSMECD